jgi:para-nitrobenzyl esterase
MGLVVETRSGRVEGILREGAQTFLGIPYARPPLGARRFAAPEREEPWSGVRRAHAFGPSAPQQPMALPLPGMDVGPMDEDCLYLNVYTPAADTGRRPVLFWIHGGGFVIGSASQPIYDGAPLAKRGDVVVVTINYRLGPLGFLHLCDLCPDLDGATGNAGIRDQVAALEWVRDDIAAFGGDPDCVTIFGESAGGMSVSTLLGMPAARGLFSRAIPQSGAAHNVHTRETATQVAEHFLAELGVSPASASRTLRETSPDRMLDTHQQTMLKLGSTLGLLPFQPLVDGDALPEAPLSAVRAGAAGGVDLLTGTTRDEWKLFGMMDPGVAKLDESGLLKRLAGQLAESDARAVLDAYRDGRPGATPTELYFALETDRVFRIPAIRLAEAQLGHRGGTFMYRFDWESPSLGGALGACHAVELPFVFGLLDKAGAALFAGSGPEAERLSRNMMDAWIAFARTGDPSIAALPNGRWSPYDPERRTTAILDRECTLEIDPASREREVWEGIL